MEMNWYIVLPGGKITKTTDIMVWGQWMENADRQKLGFLQGGRIVARSNLEGGVYVSTVFLGIDHVGGIFETMIFGGSLGGECQERCATYEEALKMHNKGVAVAKGEIPYEQA